MGFEAAELERGEYKVYASVLVCVPACLPLCVCVCVVEGLQTKHADRTRWLTPTEKKGGGGGGKKEKKGQQQN